jgi:hypothetical protein
MVNITLNMYHGESKLSLAPTPRNGGVEAISASAGEDGFIGFLMTVLSSLLNSY